MTTRSMLAVPAVVGIALAPTLSWFFAAWVLAGVAMAGTLYPPAFAALTRWWGPRRVTALTALTLLAGLASTVFAPLTAALLEQLQWRAHLPGPRRHPRPAHHSRAPVGPAGPLAAPPTTRTRPARWRTLGRGRAQPPFPVPGGRGRARRLQRLRGRGEPGPAPDRTWHVHQRRRVGARPRRSGPGPRPARLPPPGRPHHGSDAWRAHPRADRHRHRPARPAARPRCAAHRRRDARRCRPRRVHPAAGHRDQRPLGCHPLRPPQRPALRPALLATAAAPWAGAALARPSAATHPCSRSSPGWPRSARSSSPARTPDLDPGASSCTSIPRLVVPARPRTAVAALIAAAACWAIGTVVSKQVVDDVAPLTLLPVQLAVSCAFLLVVALVRREPLILDAVGRADSPPSGYSTPVSRTRSA